MATKTQILANQRFVARAYDRMVVTVPKGEREKIKAAAAEAGESMNQFIVKAIYTRMGRE